MTDFEQSKLWKRTLGAEKRDALAKSRSRLRDAFYRFRERAEQLGTLIRRDLPEFTAHDISHSDALWTLADTIAGDDFRINPLEAYILGGSFLLHDLGLSLGAYPGGLDEVKKSEYWKSALAIQLRRYLGRAPTAAEFLAPDETVQKATLSDVLRRLHAERAEKMALISWTSPLSGAHYYLIEDSEIRESVGWIIGKIAHSHWWSVSEIDSGLGQVLGPPAFLPDEWHIYPLKLACLLRTADAAHMDARRSPHFLHALLQPIGLASDHHIFQSRLNKPLLEGDRLKFTATPFPLAQNSAWWLCYDTLNMLDRELRTVDALLADRGSGARLRARSVAGVESPARLAELIPTDGWEPVDARLRISDVVDLVQKLGGRQLYGNKPMVPLRELLQNALDAVRARRVEEDRDRLWGSVIVRSGADSYDWIEVEDDGVGMSPQTLTGSLLDFGQSIWDSPSVVSELPKTSASEFIPAGRFGVGFFSIFMWGDRVKVTSRRFDRGSTDTFVLEFQQGLRSRPLLRKANRSEQLRDGGTRVTVYLTPDVSISDLVQTMTWQSLIGFLAPCSPVDIFLDTGKGQRSLVVRAHDWKVISAGELAWRIGAPGPVLGQIFEAVNVMMRPLLSSNGEIVGRAALTPSYADFVGAITSGGLMVDRLTHLAGFLMGEPVRAARDRGIPTVDRAALSAWATEQAAIYLDNRDSLNLIDYESELAALVALCGGEYRDLRAVHTSQGPLTFRQIEAGHWPEEMVLIPNETERKLKELRNVTFILPEAVWVAQVWDDYPTFQPWTSTGEAWPDDLFEIPDLQLPSAPTNHIPIGWPRSYSFLVARSLARSWGAQVNDVCAVSDFSIARNPDPVVRAIQGTLITRPYHVFRNPQFLTEEGRYITKKPRGRSKGRHSK